MPPTMAVQSSLTSNALSTRAQKRSDPSHPLRKKKKPFLIKSEVSDHIPLTRFSASNNRKRSLNMMSGGPSDVDAERQTSSLLANYGSLSSSLVEMSLPIPKHTDQISHQISNPSSVPPVPGEAGRIVSSGETGNIIIIIIKVDEGPFRVGRHSNADLTINKPTISSWHCKLYAIECDTGERLVCLEDTSTNGIRYNSQLVHKRAVILNDKDTIELSGEKFTYFHSAPPGQWQGVHITPGEDYKKPFGSFVIISIDITSSLLADLVLYLIS
ncbi:SMAD/FHA domain-containing protein [Melampsora americana]|nr:SMAD/FHA domain-containing protein [Melampsora americana]